MHLGVILFQKKKSENNEDTELITCFEQKNRNTKFTLFLYV
jgi:hypothetical protein